MMGSTDTGFQMARADAAKPGQEEADLRAAMKGGRFMFREN